MMRKRMRRSGWTLLEVAVAVLIGSVLAGMSVTLIASVLRVELAGRRHAEESRSLERLAEQFRRDVHASTLCELLPGPTDLLVTRPVCRLSDNAGWRAEYSQAGVEVNRRELRDDQLVKQDSYRMPAGIGLRPSREQAGAVELIALQLEATTGESPAASPPSRRDWSIRAELGRERRQQTIVAETAPDGASPNPAGETP